jgi:hypothetical protein
MTDPASNRANIYGILTLYASQTSMNLYWTGAFCSKKFNHHSLPSTYILNICHFAPPLCWKYVTEAPMILVELDSVSIQWVRQETLPGAIL